MSETLHSWIKAENLLPNDIKSFEKDFSNGYLFAVLLYNIKIIDKLTDFHSDASCEYDIARNFRHLRQPLESLSIHLDDESVSNIMSQQLGAAAKLLYKIKIQLSRKKINFDSIMSKTSKNTKNLTDINLSQTYQQNLPIETKMTFTRKTQSTIPLPSKIKLQPLKINTSNYMQRKLDLIGLQSINETQDKPNENQWKDNNRENLFDTMKASFTISKSHWNFYPTTGGKFEYADSKDYCNYNNLDNNLISLGIDLKEIDPKIKRYTLGEGGKYIPTDILVKKVNDKLNFEKMKIIEEKEKRKIISDQDKLLNKSILKKNKLRDLIGEESKDVVSSVVSLSTSSKKFKQMQYEKMRTSSNTINLGKKKLPPMSSLYTFQPSNNYTNSFFSSQIDTFQPFTFFNQLEMEKVPDRVERFKRKVEIREKNIPHITKVMNLIIDLTEECYRYQKKNVQDLVELPGWREWVQLFIDGESCRDKSILLNKAYFNSGNETSLIDNTEESEMKHAITQEYYTSEFFDYLNYRGDFDFTIIPSKALNSHVGIYSVLGDSISTLISSGSSIIQEVKQSSLKTMSNEAFELLENEKNNIHIPKEICKNQLFGEIIELNVDSTIKEHQTQLSFNNSQNKFTYTHIPIKLCLLGHIFTGRKTQAKMINEKYNNIKIYSIEDITQKAIDLYESVCTPIEDHPKFKSLKKAQIEQMQKERDDISEKNKDIIDIIKPFASKEVDAISDELLIKLLLMNIQKDFPMKDNEVITEEINKRNARKNEIIQELDKIKEEQEKKPKTKVKEEQNFKAELEKLNIESYYGFIIVDFPKTYEQFILLEEMTTGYIQPIDKPEGKREKLVNEMTYCLDKHYHPSNDSSSLGKMDNNITKGFFDKYIWIETNEEETIRRVNNRKIDPNTKIVYHMQDNPPPENDKKLNERLIDVNEPSTDQVKESIKNFDENFPKILEYISIFKKLQKIEKNTKVEVHNDIIEIISSLAKSYDDIENKDLMFDMMNNIPIHIDYEDDNTRYLKRLNEIKKRVPSSRSEDIVSQWKAFNNLYTETIKDCLYLMNKQKIKVIDQMTIIQNGFKSFLNQSSEKKNLLDIFISKYNDFIKQYNFIKKNKLVMDEFQNDLCELRGLFWSLIRMKKKDAIEERKLIIQSGFIENQVEDFYKIMKNIFLIETTKFQKTLNIIRSFYCAFDPNHMSETNPFEFSYDNTQILNGTKELPLIDDNKESSPKIERIYLNCFKILFVYDQHIRAIDSQIKATVALNTSVKSGTTPRRRKIIKGGFEVSVYSEAKEIISHEEEIKAAISNEKKKFKLRITLLKYFGDKYIKELYSLADKTFNKLDDWIVESVSAQNDVMNELMECLKKQIDNQEIKLSYELELDNFDIYDNIAIEFPKYNLVKGKDLLDKDTIYHIDELKKVYYDLKSYEMQDNFVSENNLVDIFIKKNIIEKKNEGISKVLRELPFHYFNVFIGKILKKTDKGKRIIRIDHLFIILTVMHFTIVNEEKEKKMIEQMESKLKYHCYLNRDDFINCKLWFEENESNKGFYQKIKEFLFDINKNYNEEINFNELMKVWTLRIIDDEKKKGFDVSNCNETFYDVLFK